jgi:hypothetical protein
MVTLMLPVTTRKKTEAFKLDNGFEASDDESLGVEGCVDEGVGAEEDVLENADNILDAKEDVDVAAATAAFLIASLDLGLEY